MKPPDVSSRNTSIHTHTSARRQSENPLQTRDPPHQAPVLLEYSMSVLPQISTLNGRGSPKTRTQLAWAIPRGSEIQLPYMDMYFQIGEETPKSDLQSEPQNPYDSQSTLIRRGQAGKKWYLRCRVEDNAGLSYSCFFTQYILHRASS